MRWNLILAVVLLPLIPSASAQETDPAHPKTPIAFAYVELQPGGNLLVKETNWVYEQVEQQYTVMVPVTEEQEREVNGRTETYSVTRDRQETRTRMVTMIKPVPVSREIPKDQYSLYQMSGGKLTSIPPGGQPAILVNPYEKLDVWYRKIVRPDAVVVTLKAPDNQVPPLPAPQSDAQIPPAPVAE